MGTEVKLKREAIERRIAELEGKMPDIQASKEGAAWMQVELTRWHDPKKEPPKNNVCVLLKVVDQLDNETIYLGSREGIEYMTDGGLVFGTDFDNESMPDMNVKVIGWREIL